MKVPTLSQTASNKVEFLYMKRGPVLFISCAIAAGVISTSLFVANKSPAYDFSNSAPGLYTEKNGKIYYDGTLIRNADPNSFEALNNIYSRDDKSVYSYGKVVQGADPTSIKVIDSGEGFFAYDNEHVFNMDGDLILGADPKSFVTLERQYGKDRLNIYYLYPQDKSSYKVEGVDIDSFETIFVSDSEFDPSIPDAKDKNNFYLEGKVLQ